METLIYVNGEMYPADVARISPLDRGFLFGDGLFETMRAYNGRVHLLRRHLDRLSEGAGELQISLPDREELTAAIRTTVTANNMVDGIVRLTISRGVGGLLQDFSSGTTPTIIVHVRPLLQNGSPFNSEGIITVRSVQVSPEPGVQVKSLNYLRSVRAGFEISRAGVREGVLLTPDGFVAEGSVSNLFCVRDRSLWTPPAALGILLGITRQRVLELADLVGIPVRVESFSLDFLKNAAEVFYTNSVREVVGVSHVDDVGIAAVGEVTRQLAERYREEAPDEWG